MAVLVLPQQLLAVRAFQERVVVEAGRLQRVRQERAVQTVVVMVER
jgi:hypothetical protein